MQRIPWVFPIDFNEKAKFQLNYELTYIKNAYKIQKNGTLYNTISLNKQKKAFVGTILEEVF